MAFRNFNFFDGRLHALRPINLDIVMGLVRAFIGPSGCGKSTLLRGINRMYELYPEHRADGELKIAGKSIFGREIDVCDLRARVGRVFLKPTPFPMSINDNIAFGVRLHERLSNGSGNARPILADCIAQDRLLKGTLGGFMPLQAHGRNIMPA